MFDSRQDYGCQNSFLNTKNDSQVIPQGTELGKIHDVEEVRELDRVEEEPVNDLTPPEAEALKLSLIHI